MSVSSMIFWGIVVVVLLYGIFTYNALIALKHAVDKDVPALGRAEGALRAGLGQLFAVMELADVDLGKLFSR